MREADDVHATLSTVPHYAGECDYGADVLAVSAISWANPAAAGHADVAASARP